jgi:hypothetical protein
MRNLGFAGLFAGVVVACSSMHERVEESSAAALSDDELARQALTILGAPQLRDPNSPSSCSFTGCHSINPLTLRQWNQELTSALAFLSSGASKEEKINYLRQDPQNPSTGFTPERIGVMAAGVHFALGAQVSKDRHPQTYAEGQMFAELFRGQDALYSELRDEMLMPVLPEYARLSATEYETVLTWFKKGMPKLDDIMHEDRPTACVDDFAPLKNHASAVKGSNWSAQNRSNGLPMFACAPEATSPTQCFMQKRNGVDVFASAADTELTKPWPQEGSTVRVLRELSSPNSFWLRSSADGRFAATGGGRNGGAQAIDLQATLDGGTRDIGLEASYDPDFWPDNKAFMFQGGTKFCAQSLLEKPSTTHVTFGEPECSNLGAASGLYQTVGQQLGDNAIGDRYIVYSIWAGDSGQYSATARDTVPRAGADSAINVYVAVAKGNDVEGGYRVFGDAVKLATPYRGDTMMARSGKLLGSRVAGEHGALGYAIESLESRIVAGHYRFDLSPLGKVCMRGNKANFSFDERFLATHHYNEPSDFGSGAEDAAYRDKGSADVWVADFVTGRKVRAVKMGPGQFALYAHFRSDGWLYFLVVDHNTGKYFVAASDWAVRQVEATPTP